MTIVFEYNHNFPISQSDQIGTFKMTHSSTTSVTVPNDGNVYLVVTSGGVAPEYTNSTYGGFIIVKNKEYGVIFKGSGITVTVGSSSVSVSSGSHTQPFSVIPIGIS